MKEILVPVDFSEESMIALEYAIALANHLKANVRIIHVKTDALIVPFFSKDKADDRLSQDVQAWCETLYDRYIKQYNVHCGVFDYKIREGVVVKEISNQARYGDSTIMVLGAHKVESNGPKWLGSPAYRLVAHSPCPVIVLNRGMALHYEIKNIALPVDYSVASRKKVPAIAGLAKLFKAKVHVVGLLSSDLPWMNAQMRAYVKLVSDFLMTKAGVEVVQEQLTGREYAANLMHYADTHNIDLLTAHVHHTNNPFVRLYQSFTNELINHSVKPVLIIPTKD
ncbi:MULTISPECIES: universal stress protein [unclassified Carboxylicivirga]|uniref:universal stress protein n=1 Tax=Carboxylicivirga TaxID=1628153 RepID=UPI003D328165